MLKVSMHQPNFLPYIGFFDKIKKSDLFIIVDHCTFSKGKDNWHHRNKIRIFNEKGWDYLTVPVSGPVSSLSPVRLKLPPSDFHFPPLTGSGESG